MLKIPAGILWVIIFKILISNAYAQSKPSSAEYALADSLGFDRNILTKVHSAANSNSERFYQPGIVEIKKGKQIEKNKVYQNGLLLRIGREKADQVINKLGSDLSKKGYLIFKSEGNLRTDPYRLGVFKTNDQFEILKMMGTNASHYGHDNAWVIAYAKSIFDRYPFRITGADIDWMEARFITPPKDWTQFAQELYADCPDIFDNEGESIEEVAKKMKSTNTLYLLWE